MKKIEAYIRHDALEGIHYRLAAMGLPTMSVTEAGTRRASACQSSTVEAPGSSSRSTTTAFGRSASALVDVQP